MSVFPEFVSADEALTDMIKCKSDVWRSRIGGAGFNVARTVARLGMSSAFAGTISTDVLGYALREGARAAGLDLRFLQQRAKSPLLAMVHHSSPPDYFFIGDDSADLYFSVEKLPSGWERQARLVHFGGISLARQPLAGRLVELARSLKASGVMISYDPNFRKLMDESYDETLVTMARLADVIKVSDEDLEGLFRTPNTIEAFERLRQLNPSARVLLTRGAAGAEYHVGSKAWHAHVPPVDVVDTIGAGDASIAGLLYGLVRQPEASGADLLRMAMAAGAAACTLAGATPPTLELVRSIEPSIEIVSVD